MQRLLSRWCAPFTFTPPYLLVGPDADFPEERNMAYSIASGPEKGRAIYLSPAFLLESSNVQNAVLAHELGHCFFLQAGKAHSELDADAMGEVIAGMPIRYDVRDVQTWGVGQRPRPAHLPR